MKNLPIFILLMLISGFIHAQENWQILLHKKLLFSGKESNEEKNIVLLKTTDWKKNGFLEVRYKEEPPHPWPHSIQFMDKDGNPLLIKDSVVQTKVSTSTLRKLFAGKKLVKIYLIISPPNPMMAAPSRIKHLVTLKLP